MCGIFGYIGKKNASEVILEGLKRLEYRGYDSWGIAVLADQIKLSKKVGAIGDLDYLGDLPVSTIGIGHTRWATHGGITQENAHPHYSSDGSFVLAQNGIVENYQKLKKELLEKGFKFNTETDTEVIVRLVEDKFHPKDNRPLAGKGLEEAVKEAFRELEGRNTIIVLSKDGQIIAARNGSPLVVGLNGETGEVYLSSDTLSFAPHVKKIIVVENNQMVSFRDGKLKLLDLKSDKEIPYRQESIDVTSAKVDKEGYDHFMLKEIQESPYVIRQVLNQDEASFRKLAEAVAGADNVYTIGSGTAGLAASQIAFYLRVYAKIKATALIGADAQDYLELVTENDLIIAPSQSGETADVLEVLEKAKTKGVKIASYVNMQGSSISRLSDYPFYSHAGPEICVMSTKVFTSQLAWGYFLAKLVAGQDMQARADLKQLAQDMEQYLAGEANHEAIKKLADKLVLAKDIFLMGKYQNLNIIKEGMVKLIEGTYKHAHGIPAGDLKHYAITLMEKGVPVIVALSKDAARAGVLNAVNEVKARGAWVIGITGEDGANFDYLIKVPDTGETSAILNIIPLQLLAYYMAVKLGNNVDKPRNIAKSVTVK